MYEHDLILCHSGTKGMHWGLRRWQNKDGSLTPAGREHYGVGKERKKTGFLKRMSSQEKSARQQERERRKVLKKQETIAKKEERAEMNKNARKQKLLREANAEEIYKNRQLFTYDELNAAVNRINLENRLRDLQPTELSKGEKYVKKMQSAANSVNATAEFLNKGSNFYNSIAKIHNNFSSDEERWNLIGEKNDVKSKKQKEIDKMTEEINYLETKNKLSNRQKGIFKDNQSKRQAEIDKMTEEINYLETKNKLSNRQKGIFKDDQKSDPEEGSVEWMKKFNENYKTSKAYEKNIAEIQRRNTEAQRRNTEAREKEVAEINARRSAINKHLYEKYASKKLQETAALRGEEYEKWLDKNEEEFFKIIMAQKK